MRKRQLPADDPRAPATYNKRIVYAVKALVAGNANDEQQKIALNWIINNCCGAYDLEFRADDRSSAFAGGKRFVGLQIIKLVNMTGRVIETLED